MVIKKLIDVIIPEGSSGRFFAGIFRHHPLGFLPSLGRSLIASRLISGRFFPLCCILYPGVNFYIKRHSTARVYMRGRLIVRPFLSGRGHSRLLLSSNSRFRLDGDFEIGQGVALSVAPNAELLLGGRYTSSGSGISANTIVMVGESLEIGRDVIISWDCTITDSNWHEIKGSELSSHTSIGDRVWISHRVSITKGAKIPDGCIVGAGSVVGARSYPENSLLAGAPATVKKENVLWSR